MSWREDAKKRAALEAVKLVKRGDVVGLGTGSTAAYAIRELGRKIHEEGLRVVGIPTSRQTAILGRELKIPMTTLDEHPHINIAIDGADQVDPRLNLMKGMGGALAREKVVGRAADRFIIIVDETKLVERLGLGQGVPVEALSFAGGFVARVLRRMGGEPVLRLLEDGSKPWMTDNGNIIFNVDFGVIDDPETLEREIKLIPGVVEDGIFVNMTDLVYVGYRDGVKTLEGHRHKDR